MPLYLGALAFGRVLAQRIVQCMNHIGPFLSALIKLVPLYACEQSFPKKKKGELINRGLMVSDLERVVKQSNRE